MHATWESAHNSIMTRPSPSTEAQLISKLLRTWHLNVADRKALANRSVSSRQLTQQLEQEVLRDGRYPEHWTEDTHFEGGLLKLEVDGSYSIYWKAEVGMGRSQLLDTQHFADLPEACASYARRFFGSSVDGVPITWES